MGFKVLGISHIGLAPSATGPAKELLTSLLGLQHLGDEDVPDQQTRTTMLASGYPSNHGREPRLELLEPLSPGQGPIAKFLEKKGSGIHHLALAVDDIDYALIFLKSKGVRLVDEFPRTGAHNSRIAFIHPASTGGLLIELVQEG